MKLPIIINANGDIYFYDTLEEAELDIEPTDVRNNEYRIYDSEGFMLLPVIVNEAEYSMVKIQVTNENRKVELINSLVDFFSTVGKDLYILETMSLQELIELRKDY